MKLIFSRKGLDSEAGGAPSPIVDGRPVSLPIPYDRNAATTYDDLGLGDLVVRRPSEGRYLWSTSSSGYGDSHLRDFGLATDTVPDNREREDPVTRSWSPYCP